MYIDAIEKLASADIRNIDTDSLIDAGDMSLDTNIPLEIRAQYLVRQLGNPYCFKVGSIAVKLEFDNDASESVTNQCSSALYNRKLYRFNE